MNPAATLRRLLPTFCLVLLPLGTAVAATVEVTLTEYSIEMPESLPAGPTTFVVHNKGEKSHAFRIKTAAGEERLSGILRPQATGTLEVTLKPGTYQVYCPISSHESRGMTHKLVVREK